MANEVFSPQQEFRAQADEEQRDGEKERDRAFWLKWEPIPA